MRFVGPSAPATKRRRPSRAWALRQRPHGEARPFEVELVNQFPPCRSRPGRSRSRRRCSSRRGRSRRGNSRDGSRGMASGCVRIRRSLLPFSRASSPGKRSPRKSASLNLAVLDLGAHRPVEHGECARGPPRPEPPGPRRRWRDCAWTLLAFLFSPCGRRWPSRQRGSDEGFGASHTRFDPARRLGRSLRDTLIRHGSRMTPSPSRVRRITSLLSCALLSAASP